MVGVALEVAQRLARCVMVMSPWSVRNPKPFKGSCVSSHVSVLLNCEKIRHLEVLSASAPSSSSSSAVSLVFITVPAAPAAPLPPSAELSVSLERETSDACLTGYLQVGHGVWAVADAPMSPEMHCEMGGA